jgi:hypothetical protein
VRFEVARFLVGLFAIGGFVVTDLEAAGFEAAGSIGAGFEAAGSVGAGFEAAGSVGAGLLERDFEDAALDVARVRAVRLAGAAFSAAGWGAGAADSGTVP